MNTQKKSFIQRIKPYNYSFGTKLNILVISLVFISLFVTNYVSSVYFKVYIQNSSTQNLERVIVLKKTEIENKYKNLLDVIAGLSDEMLGNDLTNIKNGVNTYIDDIKNNSGNWNDSLKVYENRLTEYYNNKIIDQIEYHKPNLEMLEPSSLVTKVLQYHYLVNNPYTFKNSFKLADAKDLTDYSSYHKKLQKKFEKTIRSQNIQNLYLIESEHGNIVYSYRKNIAFGNNIYSKYLKESDLASAYQRALLVKSKKVVPLDYNFFLPEHNKPVAFFSVPVFVQDQKVGVLIAEISDDYFNPILVTEDESINSAKNRITTNIIGQDKILRNKPFEEIIDSLKFFRSLDRKIQNESNVLKLGTGTLLLNYDENLTPGDNTIYTGDDFMGVQSFIGSIKLNLKGQDWYLVATSNYKNAFAYFNKVNTISVILFFALSIFSIFITYFFRLSIIGRINKLISYMKKLASGKHIEKNYLKWRDEISELLETFYELSDRIDFASDFALKLSKGNYAVDFNALSDDDKFALALNTLKKALEDNKKEVDERAKEDNIRNWNNEGIAKFNDLLRQSNNDIKNLAYIIIENLIDYVSANIGGVYLVEGDSESEKQINLIASYAYDRKKQMYKTIEIGEGLIGNCYLEKKPVYLKKLPQDYMEIGTGLGKTLPRVLYIVPLLYDQEVLGFVELASLEEFKPYEIEFIDKLAENIAATFSSVRLNTKTSVLLEESKRRANEIAQQEEEMRQNLEEMQATQEELARLRDEDEQKTKELQNDIDKSRALVQEVVNSMTGEVYVKNADGIIILANEEIASRFNSTPQKMVGKTDNDLFTKERADKEHELDSLVVQEGVYSDEIVELVGAKEQKYFVVKKPFRLSVTKETGVITIRNKR
jgi:PAS domain-containing protein